MMVNMTLTLSAPVKLAVPPFSMSDDVSANAAPSAAACSAAEQDIIWMRQVGEGDTDAFRELIEVHQSRVIGTVVKMLGDDTDAEDIAQQVFIRVWNSAKRYQPTAKFTTWLFKITRNLVFNELRRRRRHPVTPLEREAEEFNFQAPDLSSRAPDRSMLDSEMQTAIQKAIDSLPEIQRMAIVLRRYEEMPYEEIAVVLKLSVPAVKSVLFRARVELRERLQKYLDA
jgi:RNA polymerase sigma-70 factor (ECF subfamily)